MTSLCKGGIAFTQNAAAQMTLNALLLSECAYKAAEQGQEYAAQAASTFQQGFPPGLCTLRQVQTTLPHVHQRWAGSCSLGCDRLGRALLCSMPDLAGDSVAKVHMQEAVISQTPHGSLQPVHGRSWCPAKFMLRSGVRC